MLKNQDPISKIDRDNEIQNLSHFEIWQSVRREIVPSSLNFEDKVLKFFMKAYFYEIKKTYLATQAVRPTFL